MRDSSIRYLKQSEIDRTKWDECIEQSVNGIIYARSDYLDLVADNWDALVLGDYAAVFPLPLKKKWSGVEVRQPLFCQQLGLIARKTEDLRLIASFLQCIPSQFKHIELQINEQNQRTENENISTLDVQWNQRKTYLLRIDSNGDDIKKNYSTNVKRNIKKALKANLQTELIGNFNTQTSFIGKSESHLSNKQVDFVSDFMQSLLANQAPAIKGLSASDYQCVKTIISTSLSRGIGLANSVRNNRGELMAANFFLKSQNPMGRRFINLFATTSPEGRANGAMHLGIDSVISRFRTSNEGKKSEKTVLDFEGSMIEGIARFYASFGAQPFYFWKMRIDRRNYLFRKLNR